MSSSTEPPRKIPVWLDCDPGHDDAIAMMLACTLPWFNLLGVSTVHGNAPLENTTPNALAVLTAFKQQGIKVYPGAAAPMKYPLEVAAEVHGKSGLDGTNLLPEPGFSAEASNSAVPAMAQAIRDHAGDIALVCTGTMTNLGELVQTHPDLLPKIKNVGVMGGGMDVFNWPPGGVGQCAEFNIYCDPHAARLAFTNPVLAPKTLIVPLDVTHTAIANSQVRERIQGNRSNVRQMLYELLTFFGEAYKGTFGFEDGPPVHDALAMVSMLHFYQDWYKDGASAPPDLGVKYTRNKLDVILDGGRRGQTVKGEESTDGVMIETGIDVPKFWGLVYQAIEALD